MDTSSAILVSASAFRIASGSRSAAGRHEPKLDRGARARAWRPAAARSASVTRCAALPTAGEEVLMSHDRDGRQRNEDRSTTVAGMDAEARPARPAGDGGEPDYRFTLANERTFLAWIRTALGLLAGGVAVRQLVEPFDVGGGRTVLALLAVTTSALLSIGGYVRWRAVQRAMRRGEPLPPARLVPFIAAGLVLVAVVAFVLIALE